MVAYFSCPFDSVVVAAAEADCTVVAVVVAAAVDSSCFVVVVADLMSF